jgi:hypothetical protein
MMAGRLSPYARLRELLCNWFSLTRAEAGSLLLVLAILLAGLVARAFLR